MKKLLLLTLCLVVLISLASPALAQTTDEILSDANNEAVLVVSSSIVDLLKIAGVAIGSILVIYAYALYRSSPHIVQELIIKNGETVLKEFREHSEKTVNKIDDKLADVATSIFHAVIGMIDAEDMDEDETPPLDTPLQ